MNNFTDLTKEQLKLLDKQYLYFGSSIKHSVISANKFLTLLPGIASIFVINKNDLYQGIITLLILNMTYGINQLIS